MERALAPGRSCRWSNLSRPASVTAAALETSSPAGTHERRRSTNLGQCSRKSTAASSSTDPTLHDHDVRGTPLWCSFSPPIRTCTVYVPKTMLAASATATMPSSCSRHSTRTTYSSTCTAAAEHGDEGLWARHQLASFCKWVVPAAGPNSPWDGRRCSRATRQGNGTAKAGERHAGTESRAADARRGQPGPRG